MLAKDVCIYMCVSVPKFSVLGVVWHVVGCCVSMINEMSQPKVGRYSRVTVVRGDILPRSSSFPPYISTARCIYILPPLPPRRPDPKNSYHIRYQRRNAVQLSKRPYY